MRTTYESVLHTAVIAPVLVLAAGIAIVCLACRIASRIGDRLSGERPWRRSGFDGLRAA
ncbi:MAG: hypothetical protein H0T47_00600 [Planctomycetaceae bacterium]|nr:hypothetical protein [Planctomycetaceae bacterium]